MDIDDGMVLEYMMVCAAEASRDARTKKQSVEFGELELRKRKPLDRGTLYARQLESCGKNVLIYLMKIKNGFIDFNSNIQ